jgi:iron complex outermembrane receptor protein
MTHHLLLGVDTEKFELKRYQTQYRPAPISATSTLANLNAINIFNPVYGNVVSTAVGAPNVSLTFNDTETQKSYGAYLADQIELTERFRLRVGGRYDSFKRSFVERRPVTAPVPLSTTSFSPQVGVVFLASDAFTLYTAYAEGFRPNSGSNFQNVPFGPEETESYEVGLKFASGSGNISGNVAIYRMKKSNVLTADPVNSGFSIAIGAAVSKGLEFDIAAALPGDTQLMLAYAYTNAEAATSGTNVVLGGAVAKGDRLLNIPEHNASLLMLKDLSVGGRTLTLGAGAKYVSERLGQVGTTYYLPAYTLVRAMATYQVSEKFKITGDVTNLFDKQYYPTSFYALWTAVGEPRQFQLRANYAF